MKLKVVFPRFLARLALASVGVAFAMGLTGCASVRSGKSGEAAIAPSAAGPHEIEVFRVTDPEPPAVVDAELDKIPIEMNPLVERWIQYFQGRGRVHMERYLARSGRYSKLMQRILRQNGLPEELIYIALIESGFSSRATSRAAAVGYWQFIRDTGRRYGLEINSFVDERRDPVLSTQAAAEYFKGLYSIFGSWYLSMASYNVGENRVKREVMKNETRDFWELARLRKLPRETINYVPKYVAAKLIGRNPEKYGFYEIEYEPAIEFEMIRVANNVNLRQMAGLMNMEYSDLKMLNPKFKGEVAPLRGSSLELRVPLGQTQVGLAAAQKSLVDRVSFVADAGETKTYRVRAGDSLYTIARRFRTTVAWLRDTNDLRAGRPLRVGQRLQVPERGGSSTTRNLPRPSSTQVKQPVAQEDRTLAKNNPEVETAKGKFYIVQKGDTLSSIAEEYDSTVGELRRMNRLSRGAVLKVGARLKVPKDDEGIPAEPTVEAEGGSKTGDQQQADEPKSSAREGSSVQRAPAQRKSVQVRSPNTNRVAPRVAAAPPANRNAKRTTSRSKVHVVRQGENLTAIARRYRVSLQDLKEQNRMKRGTTLLAGARLVIPQ